MKKTLLSIILLFSIHLLMAQAYVPFPTSNATWKISADCVEFDISVIGDTIINSQTFHMLVGHRKDFFPNSMGSCINLGAHTLTSNIYYGAYRNDSINKKVFFVPPGDTLDTLLYDFDLSIGDTLPPNFRYDSIPDILVVDSIDSVNIGGKWRKRFLMTHCFYFLDNTFIEIIEGIGGTHYALFFGKEGGNLNNCFPAVHKFAGRLQCMKDSGLTIYPNSSYQCNVIVGLETLESKRQEISIYPNPTNGLLFIPKLKQLDRIQLYNIQGKLIKEIQPNYSSETTINIEGPSGMYFIRIQMRDGTVSSTKVIKQ